MLKILNKSRHTKKQYKKRNYSKKSKKNKNKKNKNNSKKMKGGVPTPLTTRDQRLEALKAGRQKKKEQKNNNTRKALIALGELNNTLKKNPYKSFFLTPQPNKPTFKNLYKLNSNINTIKTLKSLNNYWGSNISKKNSVFQFNPSKVKPDFKHYQNFELQFR